ncbi:acyl-CoA dehydrogenase [Sneathiella sp. P13V-1]|uniref:acyl-CoA dehydrogenase family protein n=1 Tax=Sneathiella sp. P13V-1 TaxID=2697366 RepID=UPI00187B6EC2|nr:acyl-CoA dehydrogenase family protein [Sneathiella sp. P13V-1]MBE7635458.1 acyl-CoA dehydrogenase [Sneathiella sp. P13V-1]
MELALKPEDEAFRQEVRDFISENLSEELRANTAIQASIRTDPDTAGRWARILGQKGWLAYNWPKSMGGPGWNVLQRYIFESECATAGAPAINSMGYRMIGPLIDKFGTQEQKDFYLPRIALHEDSWCQGYSEPGAGSDLAALQTKAESDGDDYIINGTKIWTTGAHYANRCFCLVRTSNEGKKQEGISFVLMDMDTPGITVQPIMMLSGDHELNQVFFDNVRIPKTNRIGEENQGWTVAKYLLEFERGGISYTPGLNANLASIRKIAAEERSNDGGRLIDDSGFAGRLAKLEVEVMSAEYTEKKQMAALAKGHNPGAKSSITKLLGSEIGQRVAELKMEAISYYALPFLPESRIPGNNVEYPGPEYARTVTASYLNGRASTIYAGSSEVQRTILSKQVLGL